MDKVGFDLPYAHLDEFTKNGGDALRALLGSSDLDYPKHPEFVAAVCNWFTDDGDTILDFFAGSGTTGEAVLLANSRRKNGRRFVLVQLGDDQDNEDRPSSETGIADLCRRRLRAAGKRLKEQATDRFELDTGFRAFRIDSGNFADTRVTPRQASQDALAGMISHIKDDRSDEDLLFGALLRWGVDITLPVEKREFAGRTIWLVDPPADGEEGAALIACFARPHQGKGGIDTELADAIARMKPLRVLFRDDGFISDAVMENVQSRFKQLAPDTDVKVL